jgi:hypothetical protein
MPSHDILSILILRCPIFAKDIAIFCCCLSPKSHMGDYFTWTVIVPKGSPLTL